jgi:hypothetical protein
VSERPTEDEQGTGHEQPTELKDSNPNAGGPDRAAGGMGVSSERVGHTGPGQESTDGEKPTGEPRHTDHAGDLVGSDDVTPSDPLREPEENPEGIPPKAGYPSLDPRSKDAPYKDA